MSTITDRSNTPTRSGDKWPYDATEARWDDLAAAVDLAVADKASEYELPVEPVRRPRFARFRRGRHRLTHPGQLTVARISFRHFDAATVKLPVVARQGAL